MLNLPYKQMVLEHEEKIGVIVGIYEDFDTHIQFTLNNAKEDNKGVSDDEMVYVIEKDTGKIYIKDDLNILDDKAKQHYTQIGVSYGARALLQLLAALNCSNVRVEDDLENVPSKTMQAKRKSKGKLPVP